jgi:hypothetical protein
MTEEQEQLLNRCSNSMISLLTPEELERYAEIELIEQETRQAKEAMLKEARARSVVCQLDAEEEALIADLPADNREAYRIMDPEELNRFADLCLSNAEAYLNLAKFVEMAGDRAKAQERGEL